MAGLIVSKRMSSWLFRTAFYISRTAKSPQSTRISADIFIQASFETIEMIKLSFSYFINIFCCWLCCVKKKLHWRVAQFCSLALACIARLGYVTRHSFLKISRCGIYGALVWKGVGILFCFSTPSRPYHSHSFSPTIRGTVPLWLRQT